MSINRCVRQVELPVRHDFANGQRHIDTLPPPAVPPHSIPSRTAPARIHPAILSAPFPSILSSHPKGPSRQVFVNLEEFVAKTGSGD